MDINGIGAFVSGGASGLGEATTRALVKRGARVAIADVNDEKANALAAELGDVAMALHCDVTSEEETQAAVDSAVEAFGELRLAVGCAGVGWPEKIVSKRGPHQLLPFETVVRVNLIGMFNVLRLTANAMNGQVAYSASKGGIVGMTLPAARDLSSRGIRVCTIAPGLFDTPLLAALPQEARDALGAGVPFPARLGRPAEYAQLAVSIAENPMLNGETIRLDGALRMPPK
jgi:NAD(P)-dependent dehydrogenase (short-subunit alcohol dehydrogenase family)